MELEWKMEEIKDLEADRSMSEAPGGLPETCREQQMKLENVRRSIAELGMQLKEIFMRTLGLDLNQQAAPGDVKTLNLRASETKGRAKELQSSADERKAKLDHALETAEYFQTGVRETFAWLGVLKDFQYEGDPVASEVQHVREQLKRHRDFQNLLNPRQADIDTINDEGIAIVKVCFGRDQPKINDQLAKINRRWAALCHHSEQRQQRLEEALLTSGDDMSTLRQKFSSAKKEYDAKISTMRLELEKKTQDLASSEKEAQECLKERDDKISNMEQEVAKIHRQLAQRDDEISALRLNLKSCHEKEASAQLEISALREKLLLAQSNAAAAETHVSVATDTEQPKTVSFTTSKSVYDAPWNNFARIVCQTSFTKLRKIGDHLRFDWIELQSLSESGEQGEHNCRSIVEKYRQKNGDSKKVRGEIIDALCAVQLGGLLTENLSKAGYTL